MTLHAFLADLQRRGVEFKVAGDRLLTRGPLSDEDRDLIRTHKAELLALLTRAEVLAVAGLELSDLYPKTKLHHSQAMDALKALSLESMFVLVTVEYLIGGRSLTAKDLERLRLAEHRIRAVREALS